MLGDFEGQVTASDTPYFSTPNSSHLLSACTGHKILPISPKPALNLLHFRLCILYFSQPNLQASFSTFSNSLITRNISLLNTIHHVPPKVHPTLSNTYVSLVWGTTIHVSYRALMSLVPVPPHPLPSLWSPLPNRPSGIPPSSHTAEPHLLLSSQHPPLTSLCTMLLPPPHRCDCKLRGARCCVHGDHEAVLLAIPLPLQARQCLH